ncbi:helix-turn-helix transcriptional regulator [Massilia sp. CT11-137]|uniref:helix-turn-helix transcriptional regulator n=1 Tax=Massilia sp. CT11-137 TaxID=3393901 RepID=UPI0039AF44DF
MKVVDTNARALGRVLINRKQLLKKVPLCERTILNMEKRGDFPKRFSVTPRLVAWDLMEVDDWIARHQTAGVQQPAPGTR